MTDLCKYSELPADDPRSLSCDYTGLYETHYCRNPSWSAGTQEKLDATRTVAGLRDSWGPLEIAGEVDDLGGAEYHHALAHLRALRQHRHDNDQET